MADFVTNNAINNNFVLCRAHYYILPHFKTEAIRKII